MSTEGFVRAADVPKFPSVMALVAPELSTDAPAELGVHARDGVDELRVRFSSTGLAQLLVPSEVNLGALVINELSGVFSAEGRVANADVAVRGRSFHEHVTAS